jgi:hypothetical protein
MELVPSNTSIPSLDRLPLFFNAKKTSRGVREPLLCDRIGADESQEM